MQCTNCNQTIPKTSVFCRFCGSKQISYFKKRARGSGTISVDRRYRNPYIVHAPLQGGRRIYLGSFSTADEAQQALKDYIKKGSPPLFGATLRDIYDLWSETHYLQVSKKTADCYRSLWKHLLPVADMKMTDLRTAHFQRIVDEHNGAGVSRGIKILVNNLYKYADENDVTDRNYAGYIKLPKTEKNEKIVFSKEQIAKLWENSCDRNVQAILVMIYMGFRIGEIAGLRTENIFPEQGYIIAGNKTRAGKCRIIPFPTGIPEIKEFIMVLAENAAEDGRLFPFTEHSFRISVFYSTLINLNMLDAYIDSKHRVRFRTEHHLTPHSTRHTFATLSINAGMRPELLQKIIGHASFNTTADTYLHVEKDKLIEEMGRLSKDMNVN